MKKLNFILTAIFIFCFSENFAQKKWSLRNCIDTAIVNNLNIIQSSNSVQINKLNFQQSKHNLLPSFDASASESYSTKFIESDNLSQKNNWTSNLVVSGNMTIFKGFQNYYKIKENQSEYLSSEFELEDIKNQITINILNAYLQILYSNEAIKIAENQVRSSSEQVKITEIFVQTGKQAEINLLQVKSQLASDKLTYVNSKNQFKTAILNLQQLMEIPCSENFDIEYFNDILIPNFQNENVSNIYQTSLELMPIIKAYKLKIASQNYKLNSLKYSYLPELSLSGSLSSSNTSNYNQISNLNSSSSFNDNFGTNISLILSIPIFNRFQNRTNIKIQQINLENTKINQKYENNSLRKEIEQAINDFSNAIEKYQAIEEQRNALNISYQNSNERFKNGLLSATDLLIEQNKLIKAESDILQSKYDLIFKSKIIDYYKGNKISIQ